MANVIQFRTPAQFLRHAKRLGPPDSSPRARRAWAAAALAYATAQAAERGDRGMVARGLEGLRGLGLPSSDAPGTAPRAGEPPVMERAQIQEKFLGLATAQANANVEVLRTVGTVVSTAIGALSLAGGAINDPNAKATYLAVLSTIQYAVNLATGGSTAGAPQFSPAAIQGIGSFCGVWSVARIAVVAAIDLANETAISDRNRTAAIQTIGRIVMSVGDGICNDPQLQAGFQVPPAREPGNCATLACERGFVKQLNADGSACECVAVTPAAPQTLSPVALALYNYRVASARRRLFEALNGYAGTATPRALSEAQNRAHFCTLKWAATGVQRVTGSIPTNPGDAAAGITTAGSLRGYYDDRTAPQNLECRGVTLMSTPFGRPTEDAPPSSGGGSTMLIIGGGLAIGAAFWLSRG